MTDKHTPYLKTPHVLKIINNDSVSCEEKLANIKNLIDGNKLTVAASGAELPSGGVGTQESNSAPVTTPVQSAIEKILDEIRGSKEKQYALSLLNEIDRSDYISFNPETLEIIVGGETIKFSNVKNLVQYCVSASPAQMPLAIAIFIECMIKIKLPSELLRHADAQGLRESLIKIEQLKGVSSGENAPTSSVNDAASGVAVTNDEVPSEPSGSNGRGQKRAREEDDDAVGESATLNPAKKSYGLAQPSLDKIRTNPKLRDAISEKWHDVMTKATPTSKSRKRHFPSVTVAKSQEEEDDEWYDAKKTANPTTRSKKRKVNVTFDDGV